MTKKNNTQIEEKVQESEMLVEKALKIEENAPVSAEPETEQPDYNKLLDIVTNLESRFSQFEEKKKPTEGKIEDLTPNTAKLSESEQKLEKIVEAQQREIEELKTKFDEKYTNKVPNIDDFLVKTEEKPKTYDEIIERDLRYINHVIKK